MSLLDQMGAVVARLKPDMPTDPMAYAHGAIGAPVSRLDGPLKAMGRARFAAEVQAPGLVYASLVFSTIARGRIGDFDIVAAEQAPGVVLVMTHRNAPRLKPPPAFGSSADAISISSLPVMQDASIHWNGEPVAIVLADTQLQADHAASLVQVTYEPAPANTDFAAAQSHSRVVEKIMNEKGVIKIGDAEAALKSSACAVDLVYHTPRHMHCAIEPHAATILWDSDQLIVHDATQMIHGTRFTLAKVFGLPEKQVRVFSPYVGGGFGSKGLWSYQILAAAASRLAGRPVRMALSREAVFRITGNRAPSKQRVALGADTDGTLKALIHTGVTAMTSHNNMPEPFTFPARHLYASETFLLEQKVADLDMMANTFMRAPGESVGTFALECALDELAEKLALDPIALRMKLEPGKDPTSGHEFSARNMLETYRRGAQRFGWSQRLPTPGAHRDGEWLVGMGVATGTYPYYRMPGGAARMCLTADGKVVVQIGGHEMGMGTTTVQTQQTAQRMGLSMAEVTIEYGDSDLPHGTLAGGSSQTASIGMAVIVAHEALVKELLKLAGNDSPLAGLAAGEVEGVDAGMRSREDHSRYESYCSILARAQRKEVAAEAKAPLPLEMVKYSMHSYAAQFAEVRVSAVTGETRVSRFLGSFDAGRILNPKTAASQFRGGIIMGIGLALTEEMLFDTRTGRVMNPSLAEYHVPVHLDVPDIDVIWNDTPDPHAPMGAKGIGEIGITGVGAAIANAIYNATGKRIRNLPITLDKLL